AWSAWPECPCRSPRQERADQVAAPLVPAEPSWPHHRQATSLSDRKAATTSRAQPPGDKFAKIPSWLQLLCPCHSSCTLVLCPCHSSCTLVIPRSTATRNLQCSFGSCKNQISRFARNDKQQGLFEELDCRIICTKLKNYGSRVPTTADLHRSQTRSRHYVIR